MKINQDLLTRWVARGTLTLSKHSPRIMFVAGIGGVVTATVLACRATLKLNDELAIIDDGIKYTKSLPGREDLPKYGEHEYKRDMAMIYSKGILDILKLYAPTLIVGASAITLLTCSHVTLTKRNAELTATLSALTTTLTEYRNRVRKEVGEEREVELYHGIEEHEVELADGTKEIRKIGDPNKLSPYARMFDEYAEEWSKEPGRNKIFLECQQRYFNQLLQVRGHVFLNEVYDNLGLSRTKAGNIVGWVIGGEGDNYIDFRIYVTNNSMFVNEEERSIILDFNVDGVILNMIG